MTTTKATVADENLATDGITSLLNRLYTNTTSADEKLILNIIVITDMYRMHASIKHQLLHLDVATEHKLHTLHIIHFRTPEAWDNEYDSMMMAMKFDETIECLGQDRGHGGCDKIVTRGKRKGERCGDMVSIINRHHRCDKHPLTDEERQVIKYKRMEEQEKKHEKVTQQINQMRQAEQELWLAKKLAKETEINQQKQAVLDQIANHEALLQKHLDQQKQVNPTLIDVLLHVLAREEKEKAERTQKTLNEELVTVQKEMQEREHKRQLLFSMSREKRDQYYESENAEREQEYQVRQQQRNKKQQEIVGQYEATKKQHTSNSDSLIPIC
jgi:hypothetical protein